VIKEVENDDSQYNETVEDEKLDEGLAKKSHRLRLRVLNSVMET
jgi:hypothetical protein